MTNRIRILSIMLLGGSLAQVPLFAQTPPPAPAPVADTFTNLQERASYGIGMLMGGSVKHMNVNIDALVGAMKDVLAGKDMKLDEQTARRAIMEYQQQVQHEVAASNLKKGAEFLAKKKTEPGVKTHTVTLPDGKTSEFCYQVIADGSGDSPKPGDTVSVNYTGTLIDGKEFDSNAKRGQPAKFPVTGVIRGWTEALQLMQPGAKWKLFIPADLAYGDRGQSAIEPGSTLIFDVELLSVESPKAAAAATPTQPTTSDIIKVPSADEMKAGKKIEVIKASEVEKLAAEQAKTNKTAKK